MTTTTPVTFTSIACEIFPGDILDGITVTDWQRGDLDVSAGGFVRVRYGDFCRVTLADGSAVVYLLASPVTITRPHPL